jgi:hypothetical protein
VEEDRTPDLRIANAALSQLSYHPTERARFYRIEVPNARISTGAAPQRLQAAGGPWLTP